MRTAKCCTGFTLGTLLIFAAGSVLAQANYKNYPSKPIRFLVPFVAGVSDIYARIIGQKLTESWGQPVIIDNRPGAGGIIGAELAAKAPPDGYTLLIGIDGTHTIAQSLYRDLAYDPVKDFFPITQIYLAPFILVVLPSFPANSVRELIGFAKSKPDQLNYGSPATGNAGHLAGELFKSMTGIKMVHVPYKGGAMAINGLLGSEVSMVFSNAALALPQIEGKKLKALGVSTSQRMQVLPDVPTISEAGVPGYEAATWSGVYVRADTPREITGKLTAEILRILRTPEVRNTTTKQGLIPVVSTPEQFASYMKIEAARYAKLIKEAGIRID